MKEQTKWEWDEHGAVGAYHESVKIAANYDAHHRGMRDIDGENAHMLDLLQGLSAQGALSGGWADRLAQGPTQGSQDPGR